MIRVMKVLFSGMLCVALLLPPAAQAKVQMLDRIVAVVNDGVIMNSELEQRVDQIVAQFQASKRPLPPIPIIRKQILERMIVERIQLQMANKMGIRIDDSALNQTLTGIAKQNGMSSLQQFSDQVRADGQSWPDLREHIRDEMIIAQLQHREVSPQVRVTDREVKRFMSSEVGRKIGNSPHDQTKYRPAQNASEQGHLRCNAHYLDAIPRQISAHAEESRMSQRRQAGTAQQQIVAGGEYGETKHIGSEHRIKAEKRRHQQKDNPSSIDAQMY